RKHERDRPRPDERCRDDEHRPRDTERLENRVSEDEGDVPPRAHRDQLLGKAFRAGELRKKPEAIGDGEPAGHEENHPDLRYPQRARRHGPPAEQRRSALLCTLLLWSSPCNTPAPTMPVAPERMNFI